MAHFYGQIVSDSARGGKTGAVSRTGLKDSGMTAHIRGWNAGGYVCIRNIDGKDVVRVYITKGTNRPGVMKLVAEYTEGDEFDE